MSEASKSVALAHAIAMHKDVDDASVILASAKKFHAFMLGGTEPDDEDAPPVTKKKAASAPAKAPAKPAKKAAPVDDDEEEPAAEEEAEDGDVTKEQVAEAMEALLNANLRNKAIKLFAKYKAKSLSGVSPDDYAAIKQDAEDLLLSA